jgi:hypothetical protein
MCLGVEGEQRRGYGAQLAVLAATSPMRKVLVVPDLAPTVVMQPVLSFIVHRAVQSVQDDDFSSGRFR